MKIVTTDLINQFAEALLSAKTCRVHPVLAEHKIHSCMNRIAVLFVRINDVDYTLPFEHNESESISRAVLDLFKNVTVYTFDSKLTNHVMTSATLNDASLVYYLSGEEIPTIPLTSSQRLIYRTQGKSLNTAVPILKLYEQAKEYMDAIREDEPDGYLGYNYMLNVLSELESHGIFVDRTKFKVKYGTEKHIDNNDLVYGSYNMFNITGRPSNAHGRIHFSSLPKEDGTRKIFKSRFGRDGKLVQIDFDSYHIRLIAEVLDYDLPLTSAHDYLHTLYKGREVFNGWESHKRFNFNVLYGGVPEELLDIDFFKRVNEFHRKLNVQAAIHGYMHTHVFNRRIYLSNIGDASFKLFNYFFQSFETERTLPIIGKIIRHLSDKQSKIVFYNYDSIVLDFCKDDGYALIKEICSMMNTNGRYPVKIEVGDDYHSLVSLKPND